MAWRGICGEELKAWQELVLLLDDVWERIDLLKLAVPSPNSHECKIIFTTQLEEELILLWIAEGFLAEFDCNIHEARKQGEDIISTLKYACLLENGEKDDTVKMHDVIRGTALWLANDHGDTMRFIVRSYSMTTGLEVYNDPKWKEVEKLSMWGGGDVSTNFSQKPHCPNLVPLLIRNTWIQAFPTEAFVLPSTVKVLDFSSNYGIRDVPSEIGDFVNLEHMNLYNTRIRKLPEELKNLKKLKVLLLDRMHVLEFPEKVISGLLSLQAFSTRRSKIGGIDENVLLNELEGLDRLQDIRIYVFSTSSVDKILNSPKLQRCMCELFVTRVHSSLRDLFSSLGNMKHLETLTVDACEVAETPRSLFRAHDYINLRKLVLTGFHNMLDLNWLIHAPNLEFLTLAYCDSLVEVISSEDFGTEIQKNNLFCSLSYLRLRYLRNLRSICRTALEFPCLKEIEVFHCGNLKKLPFSQNTLKNLQCFIGYAEELLDQLEWEDEATKDLLSSKFRRVIISV
ncbi:probable disease resistance protein At5g63020 [Neltuma alba]|uniref:probable disease resistance protein At5g63020 n=1 Tax=Neltuma alba TaxID=207710 RepID=UPI0010A36A1F|nr:probable disease resistance protein At5g63020 [Prosopis alba]